MSELFDDVDVPEGWEPSSALLRRAREAEATAKLTPVDDHVWVANRLGLPLLGEPWVSGWATPVTIRVIEQTEGERCLAEVKVGDRPMLEWLGAREGAARRHLLVRKDPLALALFLAGRCDASELIAESGGGTALLVDTRGADTAVTLVQLANLPATYLPEAGRFHDERRRPEWETLPHNFRVGAEWEARALATTERRYMEIAAFAYCGGKSDTSIPPHVMMYKYDRAFPLNQAFNQIRHAVPSAARPRTAGVSANSPGLLSIESPRMVGARVIETLQALPDAELHYKSVYRWSTKKPIYASEIPGDALTDLRRLCSALHLETEKLIGSAPLTDADVHARVLVAGKLAAGYYRKLWQLLRPDIDVEFLMPLVRELSAKAPEGVLDEDESDEDDF